MTLNLNTYRITSSTGVNLGEFKGTTPMAALDRMAVAAGYRNQAYAEQAGQRFQGSIRMVSQPKFVRIRVSRVGNAFGYVGTLESVLRSSPSARHGVRRPPAPHWTVRRSVALSGAAVSGSREPVDDAYVPLLGAASRVRSSRAPVPTPESEAHP